MIRLLQFNKNEQVSESLLAIIGMYTNDGRHETFEQFLNLLKDGMRLEKGTQSERKKESIKTVYEELSYNFC